MEKVKCNRCGRCCVVYNKHTKKWDSCRYLIFYFDGKTRCAIYRYRIGAVVGEGQMCILREDLLFSIPNCPFNTDKPLHPAYTKNRE